MEEVRTEVELQCDVALLDDVSCPLQCLGRETCRLEVQIQWTLVQQNPQSVLQLGVLGVVISLRDDIELAEACGYCRTLGHHAEDNVLRPYLQEVLAVLLRPYMIETVGRSPAPHRCRRSCETKTMSLPQPIQLRLRGTTGLPCLDIGIRPARDGSPNTTQSHVGMRRPVLDIVGQVPYPSTCIHEQLQAAVRGDEGALSLHVRDCPLYPQTLAYLVRG